MLWITGLPTPTYSSMLAAGRKRLHRGKPLSAGSRGGLSRKSERLARIRALCRAGRLSRQLNGDSLAAAPCLGHLDPDVLAGLQLVDSGAMQDGHVDEDVLATVIG